MKYFAFVFLCMVAVARADNLPLQDMKSPHGISFTFLKSDIQNTVAVAMAFKHGMASDDPAAPATALLVPALMMQGADGKSASELFEAFNDTGGSVSVSVQPDQTYAEVSAPLKGIQSAAQLAHLVLSKPDFPLKKFLERREAYAQSLEEYDAYPDSAVQKAFHAAVVEPHVYWRFFTPSARSEERRVGKECA